MSINIAIDGPSGAGKSTVARLAAAKLGYIYIDTGALYRSIGVGVLRAGLDTAKSSDVLAVLPKLSVELKYIDSIQRVFLCGEDVSDAIRLPEASMAASNVSKLPEVRSFLLEQQKNMAKENNCLMDGRDIGTVVLPDADVKIFLTASVEERAKRRFDELTAKGNKVDFEELKQEIIARDYQDSHRKIAPLKQAEDAVLLDTSGMSVEQALEAMMNIIFEILTNEK